MFANLNENVNEYPNLAALGHSLTASKNALPETPHRLLNQKWPMVSGNRSNPRLSDGEKKNKEKGKNVV